MIQDAEKDGPKWAAAKDCRVTPIGRFLRRFHLDELPQLFNVLKGEMALVGPRPERPEFVKKLRGQIPEYMSRLRVLPGITGLAQLNLPPDTDLESVRRKLVLDLEYVGKSSVLLDISIIMCTSCRPRKILGALLAVVVSAEALRGVRRHGLCSHYGHSSSERTRRGEFAHAATKRTSSRTECGVPLRRHKVLTRPLIRHARSAAEEKPDGLQNMTVSREDEYDNSSVHRDQVKCLSQVD